MAEGHTRIYLESNATDVRDELSTNLGSLGIEDINSRKLTEQGLMLLSFEHCGSYTDKKLAAIVKGLISDNSQLFIQARYYDDYGTEIFCLNDNGKYKRYLHEVDDESAKIVKAYNHWHAKLGLIWDGHFHKQQIQRLSDMYGAYDENGKATKARVENYSLIVTSNESFLHQDIRAAYASHKYDRHVAVLQSYAAIMVAKSDFFPADRLIEYRRNFVVKDAFDSTVIGFVWSWVYQEIDTFMVITWHGDLAAKASIVVNHDGLTIDENIYFCVFNEYIPKEIKGRKQRVYNEFEQLLYPPSKEYVWGDMERDRDKYFAQNLVLQFVHVALYRKKNGSYSIDYYDGELFEIQSPEFCQEMQSIDYLDHATLASEDEDSKKEHATPGIAVEIQVQFSAAKVASRVLGIELFESTKGKSIYKRLDPPSKTWPVPVMETIAGENN